MWFMSYLVLLCPCVFFSHFSIAITSLGKERANLSAFCTFIRFVLVWFCLLPLPLAVWEGLRFVIVALIGLFSYIFSFVRSAFDRVLLCVSYYVIKTLLFYGLLLGFLYTKLLLKQERISFQGAQMLP